MRRFFLHPSMVNKPSPSITGSDARHIHTVLRLKIGDELALFDGTGMEYRAWIVGMAPGRIALSPVSACTAFRESPVRIVLAQAMLKDRKMDDLLPQAIELGINRWVPFLSERSVSRPETKRMEDRHRRWEKIAIESLKQCGRNRGPAIEKLCGFEEALTLGQECTARFIFWEKEEKPLCVATLPKTEPDAAVIAMLGPEGGFSEPEIAVARKAGFLPVSLGPRILRAETAAVAACSLLQFLYGDMGKIA